MYNCVIMYATLLWTSYLILIFRVGFGDMWLNQEVGQVSQFFKALKLRLLDMDTQTQSYDI